MAEQGPRQIQYTTTTGTGPFELLDPQPKSYIRYRDWLADQSPTTVIILDQASGAWAELLVKLTYGVPDTLTTLRVLSSYNGGSAVSFPAGQKLVIQSNPHYGSQAVDRIKPAIDCMSTANVALSSIIIGTVIDGVTLAAGKRVFLPGQTTASERGIWVVPASGSAARSIDFSAGDSVSAALIPVNGGTLHQSQVWFVTNARGSDIVGTNTLTFAAAIGQDGTKWTDGTGAPSDLVGVNGDYYLNHTTDDVYKKASGTYSIVGNLRGTDGTDGTNGTNGTNGINGFTTTTASFVMPAISSTVSIAVGSTTWIGIGQELYISDGTHKASMNVSSITDGTHVVVTNDGTTGNATAGTTMASGAKVSPAGKEGPAGAGSGTVTGPSPTTLDALVAWDSVDGTAVRDSTVFLDHAANDKLRYNATTPRIETIVYTGGGMTVALLDLDIADEWLIDDGVHDVTMNIQNYSAGQIVTIVLLCKTGIVWGETINWSTFSPPSLAAAWTCVQLICTSVDGYGVGTFYEISRTTSDPAEVHAVTATGSLISDATLLWDWTNLVSGANGTKGVILPPPDVSLDPIMRSVPVSNLDNAVLNVYPPLGGSINGGSTNAALSFAAYASATLATIDGLNFHSIPKVPA